MSEARIKGLVTDAFQAWHDGVGGPWDLLSDETTWEVTGNSAAAGVYASKEDFLTNVIGPLNARMSTPLSPTIRDLYADGDTVIVLFDAEGTARDGVPYRNTYSWFLTFSGDQVVKVTAFFDSIAFNDLWQRVPVQS